jgi:hypothetical protein
MTINSINNEIQRIRTFTKCNKSTQISLTYWTQISLTYWTLVVLVVLQSS